MTEKPGSNDVPTDSFSEGAERLRKECLLEAEENAKRMGYDSTEWYALLKKEGPLSQEERRHLYDVYGESAEIDLFEMLDRIFKDLGWEFKWERNEEAIACWLGASPEELELVRFLQRLEPLGWGSQKLKEAVDTIRKELTSEPGPDTPPGLWLSYWWHLEGMPWLRLDEEAIRKDERRKITKPARTARTGEKDLSSKIIAFLLKEAKKDNLVLIPAQLRSWLRSKIGERGRRYPFEKGTLQIEYNDMEGRGVPLMALRGRRIELHHDFIVTYAFDLEEKPSKKGTLTSGQFYRTTKKRKPISSESEPISSK